MTLFIMRRRGTEKNKGKGENKGQGGNWHPFLISFITLLTYLRTLTTHLLCASTMLALVGKTSPTLNTKCVVPWLGETSRAVAEGMQCLATLRSILWVSPVHLGTLLQNDISVCVCSCLPVCAYTSVHANVKARGFFPWASSTFSGVRAFYYPWAH